MLSRNVKYSVNCWLSSTELIFSSAVENACKLCPKWTEVRTYGRFTSEHLSMKKAKSWIKSMSTPFPGV